MNPLINLQTGYVPNNPLVSQGGLMGNNVLQQPTVPSLMNSSPGDWSQVAYNMAGRPIQGPYPSVTPPPMPPGVANGTQSSGGSSIGGTALGILGALAKNPSLLKGAYNGVSSLLGGGGSAGLPAGAASAINSSAAGGLAPVGVSPVEELPSVSSAVDAGAADAAGSGAAAAPVSGGLMGGGISAAQAGASLGAGTPGVFATGNAAAGTGTAATGGSLGALGTTAAVAAPFLFQQAALALGDAWTKKNSQGNTAMKDWMQATGAKWVPNPGSAYDNSSTFQTSPAQMAAASNPGTMYDSSGKAMTGAQAANAIYQWAIQNGINPGDFHP